METSVDKFGRIVIPKRVRENLGLIPGARIEIQPVGDTLILRPVREQPHVVDKDGVLVFTGSASGDMLEAIHRHRQERSRIVGRRVLK